jgi:hypothetical protein
MEYLGGYASLNEERSYALTFLCRRVCLVCLRSVIGVEEGSPSFDILPPSPKVDKNDITGQSVRSTRLADQEKRLSRG